MVVVVVVVVLCCSGFLIFLIKENLCNNQTSDMPQRHLEGGEQIEALTIEQTIAYLEDTEAEYNDDNYDHVLQVKHSILEVIWNIQN